jgi:hypothetical protein
MPSQKVKAQSKGNSPTKQKTACLTPEQEKKLVDIVNSLTDDEDIKKVIGVIHDMEPALQGDDDLDLHIGELSPATRVALWKLAASPQDRSKAGD